MAIQAQLHDGRILEFPDGTDPSVVQATVKKVLGVAPEAAPAPPAAPAVAPVAPPVQGVGYRTAHPPLIGEEQPPAPPAAPVASAPAQAPAVAPAAPADNLDAKLAKQQEASFAEEFGKGAKGAYEYGLPSMGEQLKLQGSADAFVARKNSLDLMGKIERGEISSVAQLKKDPTYSALKEAGQDVGTINAFFANRSNPEVSGQLRGNTEKEFQAMATDTRTSIAMLDKYARENKKKYGPRVEKFTDINWTDPQVAADFTNWLGYNMGSGAVQMAPVMLAAVATKQPGLLLTSGAMGVSEAVGARLKFIQNKVKDLPPEQQGEAIAKYIAETGDTNLLIGAASGSFDLLLGPAATAAKQSAKKMLEGATKMGAAKAAAKALPKDMAGEAVTGGLQESTQIAGKKALGEEKKRISMENVKDVFNASLAEAAGAPAGTAVNVGMAALQAPSEKSLLEEGPEFERENLNEAKGTGPTAQDYEDLAARKGFGKKEQSAPTPEGRTDPTFDPKAFDKEQSAPTPEATPTPREARIAELTERMVGRGIDEPEARAAATLRVDSEERDLRAREEEAADEVPDFYPRIPKSQITLEEQLFREYISEGVDPVQARQMAKEEVDNRQEDSKTAAAQSRYIKKAKTNVAKADTTTGGESTSVAGQPDTVQPTGGPAGLESDGVVPTGQDVAATTERESSEPTALEPESREAYAERTKDDASAPRWEDTDARVNRVAERYEEAGMPEKAAEARESLTKQRPTYAGTAEREIQQDQELATQGEPSGTETVEAEQTETQGQEQAPAAAGVTEAPTPEAAANEEATDAAIAEAAPAAEKPKSNKGRKSDPEEVRLKKKEEQDKVEAIKTKADYELRKSKNSLLVMLDDPSRRQYAIRRLTELSRVPEIRGTAVGKRIKAILEDRNQISQQEIDRGKQDADNEARNNPKKSQARPTLMTRRGTPNMRVRGTMTGAQAISEVAKNGTPFEKMLANRLRKFLGSVTVHIWEKGQPIPERLKGDDTSWNGVYYRADGPYGREVYLKGSSWGNNHGVDNITILHELLHAALNQRITAGMNNASPALLAFARELNNLMKRTQKAYEDAQYHGETSMALEQRIDSTIDPETGEPTIFTLPHEFLAYGMSDPVFQKFLMSVEGTNKNESAFTRFVRAILDYLEMPAGQFSALSDLINIADKGLSTQLPTKEQSAPMYEEPAATRSDVMPDEEPEQVKPGSMSKTAYKDVRTPNELKKDWNKAVRQVKESRTAEELANTSMLANIKANPANFLPELMSMYNTADSFTKRLLLNFATTDFLAEEWGGSVVPELKTVNANIQEMHGMTARLIEGASKVSNVIWNEFKKDPDIRPAVEDIALTATLAEVDPSTDKRIPEANKAWDALPANGKKVFTMVRDYFEDLAAMHSKLLNDQIDNLSLASEVKANLLAKVKAVYEVGDKIVPYFALVRRGSYYLRTGSGEGRQFYMFRTQMERDRVANALAKERNVSLKELEKLGEFQRGNDVANIRNAFAESSPMLTKLFDAIDAIDFNKMVSGKDQDARDAEVAKMKNDLKDSIYQLYLISMPEQSLRKQFIHREGITGFSTDMMQNFSDSASALAVQLSRIKYGPKIRSSMMGARSSIEGQPNLEPFVEEMSDRVDLELPGKGKDVGKLVRGGEHVANFLTRGAFIHYLSGASSALLQPISVFQFGLPVLGAKYGYLETSKKFMELLKVWNQYGITSYNADGSTSYQMPSMRDAKGATPLQRRAMDAMMGRNVGTATLSSTLMARQNKPADKSLSATRNALGMAWWAGSGGMLMHAAERLSQEFMYRASFDMNHDRAVAKFKNSTAYKTAPNKHDAMREFVEKNFNKWVNQAVIDTHEALGNMTQQNRPPIMRNFVGNALTQFLMFPVHNTILIGKNFFRMIKPLPQQTRIEAAKTFFGIMGTTVLVAGTVGLGVGLTIMGFLAGMWDDFWAEEEKKRGNRMETLRDMDFVSWYKGTWLPNTIGGFVDHSTEEGKELVDKLSKLVANGALNAATGADYSSRLGILNLELRNAQAGRTASETVKGWIEAMSPPSFSQYKGYLDAIHAWNLGDNQTAAEKALPAAARNLALAYEQYTKGAVTTKEEPLLSPDAVSKGQLLWRVVGFNSDVLADAQSTNFKMKELDKKLLDEKTSVMERFKVADRVNNFEALTKAKKEQAKYNVKYPWTQISDENVQEALDAERENRGMAWKGYRVSEKNAPYAVEALALSRRALDKQERDAAKKKP